MKSSIDNPKFAQDIFPAELAEISKRRRALNLGKPGFSPHPSVKNGLIGLALSGGGIRSATFSLGVIQKLIAKGKFKFIDYISTVSGGGYIGSCVSSVLNDPDADADFFSNRQGAEDPPAVKHLRNSSNYLSPGGLLHKLRLPTILLRGILLNLFLLVPSLVLAVFFTMILNELWHEAGTYKLRPLTIVIPFIFATYLIALIRRTLKKRFDWRWRNAGELLLAKLFALTISGLCLIPIFWLVRYCVDGWWSHNIIEFLHNTSLTGIIYKALFVMGGLIVFFFVIKKIQSFSKITLVFLQYFVGILGPLLIFLIYLVFCIFFIESPYFALKYADDLGRLVKECGNQDINYKCHTNLANLFRGKGFRLSNDYIHVKIKPLEKEGNNFNQQGEKWIITYENKEGKTESIDVRRQKGYLFIPDLSILEALKDPKRLIMKKLPDFARRFHWKFYLLGFLLFISNFFVLDVNITASHGFYRDRLSKAYIFKQKKDGSIISNDEQKMTELSMDGTSAPYHLINTSLNLPGSDDPKLRGRNADFFTITKLYSGSEHTGYCLTEKIEYLNNHFNLGTAMAISAAAAAPNMGAMTMKQLVFIMTLLNIRLGYWTPNPRKINAAGELVKWRWPNVGPRYLLREAFGNLNAKKSHVNLSDGGHIENLAVYQLLKRRCKLIIAVDAEADEDFVFDGLVTLIRLAEIDMGITIDIDLNQIRNRENGRSQSHWVLGIINYSKNEIGHLLYLKSSLTGDENEYIRAYHQKNPTFPDQTTADQFFDETQFECYRSLGEHIALGALDDQKVQDVIPE